MKHKSNSNRKSILSTRLFALLFCAVIPVATCLAEDVKPAIGIGSKAMLFEFSGLANLGAGAYEGGFGGKYYIMDALALRGSLQFAVASQSEPANAPSGNTGTDGSESATQFGLSVAAEYHLLKTRVSPYIGGGLDFSSTSTTRKTAGSVPTGSTYTQTVTNNRANGEPIGGKTYFGGLTLGAAGLAGVEFFITNEISLGAEYQLGFSLNSQYDQKITNGSNSTTTKEGSILNLGIGSTGILALAFYF